MKLQDLLGEDNTHSIDQHFLETDVSSISTDSRKIKPGCLFVALKGAKFDGTQFIEQAVSSGAKFILSADEIPTQNRIEDICYFHHENPDQYLRHLSKRFYDDPSTKIKVIGVTGTNGKTTITYLLESIIQAHHENCGIIGTVNYRVGTDVKKSQHTTPSLVENQELLNEMKNKGAEYCVMEVSSHALDQGRVDNIHYSSAIFTNLTSDHLDYHKTRENYFLAKSKLFTNLSTDSYAIINIDDPYGQKLVSKTQAQVVSYGIENNAQVKAEDLEISIEGTKFKLITPEGERVLRTALVGIYNVYNILAAVGCALAEKLSLDKIVEAIEQFENVPGRLEKIDNGQNFTIFIDYAHTEDAFQNVLKTIRQATDKRIIMVFGCGGDRDRTKRPLMGKAACDLADFVVVTSDNPRSEEPQAIIDEVLKGFDKDNYKIAVDRKEAIIEALKMAEEDDVVLIAGKGHENYQIFKDQTIKFNERQIIREFLIC